MTVPVRQRLFCTCISFNVKLKILMPVLLEPYSGSPVDLQLGQRGIKGSIRFGIDPLGSQHFMRMAT